MNLFTSITLQTISNCCKLIVVKFSTFTQQIHLNNRTKFIDQGSGLFIIYNYFFVALYKYCGVDTI